MGLKVNSPSKYGLLQFLENPVILVGLAGININDQNNFVTNLVFNGESFDEKNPDIREICLSPYLRHRFQQINLLMNHLHKLLAETVVAVPFIKELQDGFQSVCKLWRV